MSEFLYVPIDRDPKFDRLTEEDEHCGDIYVEIP
jgi:hypothetical protein